MRTWWTRTRGRLVLATVAGALILITLAPMLGQRPGRSLQEDAPKPAEFVTPYQDEADEFTEARRHMVQRDLAGRDIKSEPVLRAMGSIPRHLFVPDDLRHVAYADRPWPIGQNQTISQPYIVAIMTQLAGAKPGVRALDIGTGSGYQAAVLGRICKEVYSIEIVEPLAKEAKKRLADHGYKNITVRHGDGYQGWPDKAPFDLIIVAAAPDHVPQPLVDQLAKGGTLVIPVGKWSQQLLVIHRDADGQVTRRNVLPVRFVPMTGEAER